MAYTPDYTEGDLTSATIDGIGKFVITAGSFAGLIALVVLLVLGVRAMRRVR